MLIRMYGNVNVSASRLMQIELELMERNYRVRPCEMLKAIVIETDKASTRTWLALNYPELHIMVQEDVY